MSLASPTRRGVTAPAPSRALTYLPATTLILDIGLIGAALVVATVGRLRLGVFDAPSEVSSAAQMAGPFMLLGWVVTLALFGAYDRSVFGAGPEEFKRVANASLVAAGLVGVGCYLAQFDLSRGFFLLAFVVGAPSLLLGRVTVRHALHSARRRGTLRQRMLVAGTRSHVDEIVAVLRRESWLGYEVVGALTPPHDIHTTTDFGVPVLGNVDDATAVALSSGVDAICLAGGGLGSTLDMRNLVWGLEHHAVQVIVAPSMSDISSERVKVRPVGGLPLMHIDPPRSVHASRWAKRTFDVLGSLCLLVAFSPLFLLAALQIAWHDRGPVLFKQIRVGRHGAVFACFKFRTMLVDAEAQVAAMQEALGQTALLFKLKDDPRITRPGRWLRRFSIDELPQLMNVLRGDMSLVGPRPQVPREVALYDSAMSRRLHVRPGMTGLWQVSGRNELTAEEAMRLDLYYVDNWSMLQDLGILLRTFRAVVGSRGAY